MGLVIDRKEGQSLMINDDIKITIIRNERHHLSLLIEAPEKYKIWREEIYQQIKKRNRKELTPYEHEGEVLDNGQYKSLM